MNVTFNDNEPRFNDIFKLTSLKQSIYLQSVKEKNLQIILYTLLTTNFYFELDYILFFKGSAFICKKQILCRNNAKAIIDIFYCIVDTTIESSIYAESLEPFNAKDIYKFCGIYSKAAVFQI